jgi:hypothetical protein
VEIDLLRRQQLWCPTLTSLRQYLFWRPGVGRVFVSFSQIFLILCFIITASSRAVKKKKKKPFKSTCVFLQQKTNKVYFDVTSYFKHEVLMKHSTVSGKKETN